MKKKFLIFIGFFFLVVAGVMVSAPLLIESQKVQNQILNRIKSWYVVDASVDNIIFTWFPFPHVELTHIEILHEDFSAKSPQVILYPSWKVLFDFSSLGRLTIVDPVFQLMATPTDSQDLGDLAISLPKMKVHIKNGTLILPAQQNSFLSVKESSLQDISASLAVHGDRGEFTWESAASFFQHIEVSGDFGPQGYGLKGEIEGLDAGMIALPQAASLLTPLNNRCNLSLGINKNGNGIEASLQGDIPDFSLTRQENTESFLLDQGNLLLKIGAGSSFSLRVADLRLAEPQLQIEGEISRYFPAHNEPANIKIDLKAKEINLTAVRQKVLSLLGDSPVTQTVCDIVQGGKANSASYFFDAPAPAFEDVTSMTIAVDIAHSDIHIADIPLDLKNAQGPILISDGDLTGKDITTWVGDAKGTNGVFLVGLADNKFGLQVDVDIDANLEELPAILRTLLDDEDVVHELSLVQGRGRANGHLHIGDKLDDFNVTVDVEQYHDAELRYERLSWPLRPEAGKLQVTGTTVNWQGVKARLGSHIIQETSGYASWEDLTIPLVVSSFHGLFDANTLFGELKQYPVLNESFTGVVDSIQGSIEVSGSLKGPFFSPEQYSYGFETKLKDISFSTPALPEKVVIDKGQGDIGHQEIKISSSSGFLLGSPVTLSGTLSHDNWQRWAGTFLMNGILGESHLHWLTSKDVLPNLIVPRPPYRVDNMNIQWHDKLFHITGNLLSADETTWLDMDIQDKEDSFTGAFQVKSPGDLASFTLHWHNRAETFMTSFQGNLSGSSLHALLDDTNASFETISGDFKVEKTEDKETKKTILNFDGSMKGKDIFWKWGKQLRTVAIPSLDLTSQKTQLEIKEFKVDFNNESLAATGVFSHKPGTGHFELDISSPPTLTSANIENFQEDLDHFLYTTLALKKEQDIFDSYEFSGFVNFNLDNFTLPFGVDLGNGEAMQRYRLPFTPLRGNYHFRPKDSTLNLQNTGVCGVQLNGQLTWRGAQETRKEISLLTPADAPLEFKDFLSCFNFDGVVEGPLNISGRIYSDTKLCKRGGLLLTSEKGTIKKFVALAKTLSLINITGLSGAIWTEGFYYNALEISGNICDNIFTIEKAFIDGDGVDVVATGEINLSTMEYDVTFFVVPFATINGLVTKVPLVGRVLGGQEGRIVSVPVKVTGPLDNPKVTVLSPAAIGEATGKWILDTITLPFGWIVPKKPVNNIEKKAQ